MVLAHNAECGVGADDIATTDRSASGGDLLLRLSGARFSCRTTSKEHSFSNSLSSSVYVPVSLRYFHLG